MRKTVFIGIAVIIAVMLSSCQVSNRHFSSKNVPLKKISNTLKNHQITANFFGNKQIHPLPIAKKDFSTVCEWLDNENILYATNAKKNQSLYQFNIYTGKSKLFFSSDSQIVSVSANLDHSYFLIRTAPSTYEAGLIVIDKSGNVVFSWKVGSYDLQTTWNPYMPGQLYVTTFLADWSFQTYLMNIDKKTVKKSNLPIPFIQWVDRGDIAYLKWNENGELGYSAPLFELNLHTKKVKKIFDHISLFLAFPDTLLTVNTENKVKAVYTFYDLHFKEKKGEFSAPLLAKYSEWFIPEFDYVLPNHLFYTFRPYKSGNYDDYNQKYDLVSFSTQTKKLKVVMSNLAHMPIKFSPNGELCLYGFSYENMINIHDMKIIPLIQEG